jgi:hypothetical protein
MTPDALAADSAFLTIDEAVANLDAAEVEREDEAPAKPDAASPEGQNTEAEPAAEVANEPEAVIEGEDAETEEGKEEAEEAELPPVEPPRFWDAEAKKRFGELPRDLQELVLAKESERDKATSKAMEEAALKRKAADGEASKIAQLNGVLDKLIPQAAEMFKDKWENVDWDKVVDQYGADQALKLKNQMEGERKQLQQLQAAKAEADAATTSRFVAERFEQFKTVCPDLADEKDGPDRQLKLVQFLTGQGIPQDTIVKRASAAELSIAYDAMRWRQAQAEAKAKSETPKTTQPKPATQPKPTVKSTAAPARAGSPQSARIQALQKKPSLTTDELVELMDLTGT